MEQRAEHPTVKQFREREAAGSEPVRPQTLDRAWLRQVCLEAGADDVGFVEAGRPEIADQTPGILAASSGVMVGLDIFGGQYRLPSEAVYEYVVMSVDVGSAKLQV